MLCCALLGFNKVLIVDMSIVLCSVFFHAACFSFFDHNCHGQQEPDYGFDRILDLVRLRLSSPISRSESVADFEYLRCASNLSPASTLCGGGSGNGGGGGSGSSVSNTNCFGSVRKSGYLRLARTLHKRMPEVPEERLVACLETLRSQNGGLTGLRISEIREEVSRLIQEWPSSAVR